jgi:hypothetical protein
MRKSLLLRATLYLWCNKGQIPSNRSHCNLRRNRHQTLAG